VAELPQMVELTDANESDERKLWFDYIKTLNARQLGAAQRSGVTTYVLLVTLIGIIYRFGPHVPQFVAQQRAGSDCYFRSPSRYVEFLRTCNDRGRALSGRRERVPGDP